MPFAGRRASNSNASMPWASISTYMQVESLAHSPKRLHGLRRRPWRHLVGHQGWHLPPPRPRLLHQTHRRQCLNGRCPLRQHRPSCQLLLWMHSGSSLRRLRGIDEDAQLSQKLRTQDQVRGWGDQKEVAAWRWGIRAQQETSAYH